jgi:hypothetical protein
MRCPLLTQSGHCRCLFDHFQSASLTRYDALFGALGAGNAAALLDLRAVAKWRNNPDREWEKGQPPIMEKHTFDERFS